MRRFYAGLVALLALATLAGGATGHAARATDVYVQQCPDLNPAARDPGNPLMLRRPPGPNPLTGVKLFVNGPAHGEAASAIVRLLGLDPQSYSDFYSWGRFRADLGHGALRARLAADPQLDRRVKLLAKIANQPEEQRISQFSAGGGPGAIFAQAEKILCHRLAADPQSIPIITTSFVAHPGACRTRQQILADQPRFQRQVDELVAAIERRPVVLLVEIGAVGSSGCLARTGALPAFEAELRYEVGRDATLAHAVVYLEAGYSDANSVGYTARVLNAVGVRAIRGFFTNDTHNQWTINEVRWAQAISRFTHHVHVIVNTSTNGQGPKLNPHPATQGVEDLCNPPGRGLGPRPTVRDRLVATGLSQVDAFVWTGVPGNSSGSCRGGPPAGTFWRARALGLAARAQGKLGPGYASRPY